MFMFSILFGCGTGNRTPIFWFRAKRPTIRRSRKIKTVQLNRFYFTTKINYFKIQQI